MRLRTCILTAAGIGLLLPVTWLALYSFGPAGLTRNVFSNLLVTLLWPSFILMIGDPLEENAWLPAIAISLNAAVYAAVGAVAWLGRERLRLGLWPAAALAVVIAGAVMLWIAGLI